MNQIKVKKKPEQKPQMLEDSLVRLALSTFRQVARLRPDLVREEYRRIERQKKAETT